MSTETILGVLFALLAAFSFATAQLLYRVGLKTHDYLSGMLIRGSIAIPILITATIALSDLSTYRILSAELWIILVCSAIALCIGDLLHLAGLKITPLSRAVPLSATYPIFTTFFAVILLNEQPSLILIMGTCVVVAGVSLVVRKKDTGSVNRQLAHKKSYGGEILVLGAALIWGFAITLAALVLKESGVKTFPILAMRLFIVLILVFLLSIIHNRGQMTIPRREVILERGTIMLGIGGIFGFAIGMPALYLSLERIGASQAVPLSSVYPMLAAILGMIFLKEKVACQQWLGAGLIISGCILIIL
ncbi:MAG: DMT family transporter [Candidatus Hodarchaeota archaeon]